MRITDSQIHLVTRDSPERPWAFPDRTFQGWSEFGEERIRAEMDRAGVDRAVLVPPSVDGDRNDACLAAARDHPDRFAVVGALGLTDPTNRKLMPALLKTPGMLGLRGSFRRGDAPKWLDDGTVDWLWPAAEEAGIPLFLHVPGLLDRVAPIAERYSGLNLAIDHLGMTGSVKEEEIDPTIDQIVALARFPNVVVKASSLPSIASDPYPYKSMHTRIERVFDAFGPQRVFWGSDLTRLKCSYRECVTMFTEELGFLSRPDLESMMGRAVENWLGWDFPSVISTARSK